MQHSLIFQQRAAVYQWFSQLLFRELDQKQLARLESEDTRQWLASLAGIPGLSLDVKKLERSLTQALRRESRQLELAADFATLFLLAPPGGVSPYAGHYPHTTAAEERRQMNVLLVEHGLRSYRYTAGFDGEDGSQRGNAICTILLFASSHYVLGTLVP